MLPIPWRMWANDCGGEVSRGKSKENKGKEG